MKLIEFEEQTVVIGQGQSEYRAIPAHQFKDAEGTTAFCWKMTWKERVKVLLTGCLWHQVLTFNKPLQPQLLCTDKPDMQATPRPDVTLL